MEAQLRARIETLVSISKHPLRRIEHTTFKRLLYRNRNQHRHGLYFRKLEHVRRLLSHIDRHIAWESLKYALGNDDNNDSHSKTNRPLSISSLTVDDLKSAETLFDKLVNTAIVEAARRVVTDLVSREHFLPFAVSVLATLARLFVIERKLLREARGVATEMNVLFAVNGPSEPSRERVENGLALSTAEDIGLELSTSAKPQSTPQQKTPEAESNPPDFPRDRKADVMKRELPQSAGVNASRPAESEARPSLYDLVAKQVDTAKFSVEVRARTSVTLPDVPSTHSGLERSTKLNEDKTVRPHEVAPERSTALVSQQSTQECPGHSTPGINAQQPGSRAGRNNKFEREEVTHGSDSDDIDDIFEALEDT